MDDYIFIYDITHDYYYISPSAVKRFKLPSAEFDNALCEHKMFTHPDDFSNLISEFENFSDGNKAFHNIIYRWISIDNEPVWVNCRGTVIHNDDGKYMVGCINEVGRTQKADNISGLLSLPSLKDSFENGSLFWSKGYILRLGIDDFKKTSERYGDEYADSILKMVSARINNCLTMTQKLYKVGSDEFAIIETQIDDVNFAIEQYRRIRSAIDKLVIENHYKSIFTISGGILMASECRGRTFSDCMKYTEFALSEAKRQGKNRYFVFTDIDYGKFIKRRKLIQLLVKAVNNEFDGFQAYLQPLYDPTADKLYGAEALMRFYSDEFGLISPSEFVPILEETGLIVPVGRWMLCKSLELCRQIHKIAPDFRISINVSYIQVLKSNVINDILSAVADYGVLPSNVIIELTESGLLSSDTRITRLCSRMKESGIRLALDDFGTGYSNFHYFNDLNPDIIKIDRSFTVKAMENDYEYTLLSLIANMAHEMNIKVCVEGIETIDEFNKMKQLSPNYCQGYYFGEPCPYDEFVAKFITKSA